MFQIRTRGPAVAAGTQRTRRGDLERRGLRPAGDPCRVRGQQALEGFFKTLRAEHARDGLGVTLVRPSFVDMGIGSRALDTHGDAADPGARSGVGHVISREKAADAICRGVCRRDRAVWVGHEARLAWWSSHLVPSLYKRLMLRRTTP